MTEAEVEADLKEIKEERLTAAEALARPPRAQYVVNRYRQNAYEEGAFRYLAGKGAVLPKGKDNKPIFSEGSDLAMAFFCGYAEAEKAVREEREKAREMLSSLEAQVEARQRDLDELKEEIDNAPSL